jgi:hypothetical protein
MNKSKFAEFVMDNLEKGWSPEEYVEKYTFQQRTKTLRQWADEGSLNLDLVSTGALVVQESKVGLDFAFRGKGGFLIQSIIASIAFLSNDNSLIINRELTNDEIEKYTKDIASFVEIVLKGKGSPVSSLKTLGEWIISHRSKNNLNRVQFARRCGFSAFTAYRLENEVGAHFNNSTYEKIEALFGSVIPSDLRKTKRGGKKVKLLNDLWKGRK